jgi:carbonic anhydrase
MSSPSAPAPQTVDDVVLGSVEFGPEEHGSGLIFVLGHQRCGAVAAAIAAIRDDDRAPGHIQAIVDALRPAHDAAQGEPGDLAANMVRAQVRLTADSLKHNDLLAERIRDGKLMIVRGRYSLESGLVELIA